MNLSWLDDFLALASTGNFSRAADERHMTQPAFGRRIRALEEWLGVVLFDRSTHPVALTETGVWFRTVAQEILARVARVPDEARAVADASSATLRIASTHALSFSFLPGWLHRVEAPTTLGPVQLASDTMQQCEALLRQGRVQFLLCHGHERMPSTLEADAVQAVQVGTDEIVPVCAAEAPGAPRHPLDKRAPRVPVLAYSAESGIGRIVRELRGAALERAHGDVVFTAHLASVLKTIALEGRGVAFLPRSLIEGELASGRLVPAGGAAWAIEVRIQLLRQRTPLPPAAEAFWKAAVAEGVAPS